MKPRVANPLSTATLLALAGLALLSLLDAREALASFAVGVGGGWHLLPESDESISFAAPDGESKGSILLFWSGTANNGLALGASYSGYRLTKNTFQGGVGYETRWIVSEFAGYFEYRRALGKSVSAPTAALRLGAGIVPIEVEVTADAPDSVEIDLFDENSEIRVGPYVGADLRIPFGRSRFAAFASLAKTFVQSTLLREDVGVGSFVAGAGLTYVFRAPFEQPSKPARSSSR
jgi:hypothetical protein